MRIIRATVQHVKEVALLFDQYRIFYKQESNLEGAIEFLNNRLVLEDSIIFLAYMEGETAIGFTQIYPGYTSVGMSGIYTLNDLFVDPSYRNLGVGKALIKEVINHAEENNIPKIFLKTEVDNLIGQQLYESVGFVKEDRFLTYYFTMNTLG